MILGILLIANLANTVSEFAGVAASMEIFNVSKYISVPVAGVVGMVARGQGQLPVSRANFPARQRFVPWPTLLQAFSPTPPSQLSRTRLLRQASDLTPST